MSRAYHVHFERRFLIREIARLGAANVLQDWPGTDEEAIVAIAQGPPCVTVGCDCPKNPDGSCAGVEVPSDG